MNTPRPAWAGFAAIAAAGTAVASERVGFIVAAAGAAVTFAPARSYSQRLVDHFFYGQRSDSYRALSDLGRRLVAVAAPGEVLPAVPPWSLSWARRATDGRQLSSPRS